MPASHTWELNQVLTAPIPIQLLANVHEKGTKDALALLCTIIKVIYNLWAVHFSNFPLIIFGLSLREGNWNGDYWGYSRWAWIQSSPACTLMVGTSHLLASSVSLVLFSHMARSSPSWIRRGCQVSKAWIQFPSHSLRSIAKVLYSHRSQYTHQSLLITPT